MKQHAADIHSDLKFGCDEDECPKRFETQGLKKHSQTHRPRTHAQWCSDSSLISISISLYMPRMRINLSVVHTAEKGIARGRSTIT